MSLLSLQFAQKLKIIEIIDKLLISIEVHCRDLIWTAGHPATFTVFLDGKENIGLDITTAATKIILDQTDMLDRFLPSADYLLEVSSPGFEKPLRTSQHFHEAEGESIFVKVDSKIDGKVVFKGKLLQCDVESIAIEVRDKKHYIPIISIVQANLINKKLGQKEDLSHGS